MSLHEDILVAFDSCGVSCEVLDDWALRESKALSDGLSLNHVSAEYLPEQAMAPSLQRVALHQRWAALGLTQQLISLLGLPHSVWFNAVLLLDLSFMRVGWGVSIQDLPATCVAAASILSKNLGGASRKRFSDLSETITSLVGHAVSPEEIGLREMDLMIGLQWQINLPSLANWASAFCTRFHVLSQGASAAAIEGILQWILGHAQTLIERMPTSSSLSSRRMANGFFVLGLIAAQFAPLDAFDLGSIINSEWEALFPRSQPQIGLASSSLPPACWPHFHVLLQIITRSHMPTLRQDARAVTTAIRAAGASGQRTHVSI